MNPSDSRYSPWRFRASLYAAVGISHMPRYRVSSTGLKYLLQHATPATPRDFIDCFRSLNRLSAAFPLRPQGQHLHNINEATCRFTCVAACHFANWELTTPDYSDAAPLNYQGVRTTPWAGLEPARYSVVTANGRCCFIALREKKRSIPLTKDRQPAVTPPPQLIFTKKLKNKSFSWTVSTFHDNLT